MAWNKIGLYQDAHDVEIVLKEDGQATGVNYGTWWNCIDNKYFASFGSDQENWFWMYLGAGILEIGGYQDPTRTTFKPQVRLWPSSEDDESFPLLSALGHRFTLQSVYRWCLLTGTSH